MAGSGTGGDLSLIQTSLFLCCSCCVNQVVLVLKTLHFNKKSREFELKQGHLHPALHSHAR